ncbi:MAG TPA: hypothetical protein VFZ91_01900 [Allosphingosinicella sp.]
MASKEHSCTRRAVLGAAVAVPVAAGIGAGSSSARPSPPTALRRAPPLPQKAGEGKWKKALRAFRCAVIAKDRFEEASSAKAFGPGRRSFDAQEALDERFAGFVNAADSAMLRLLGTPAPDVGALAVKTALIADHQVWEISGGEDCLAWLEADARWLARPQVK